MEHEVFVPVPVEQLRAALSDPERVARAVPGLQQDAGTAPVAGRLKVRVAGHTITYRGSIRVAGQDDGSYAIEGDATEARGNGTVKLALSVRLAPAEGGTTIAFGGTATADGRIAELADDAVTTTATRLLTRFAQRLGESEPAGEPTPAPAEREQEPEEKPEQEPGEQPEQEPGEKPGEKPEQEPKEEVPPPPAAPRMEDDLTPEEDVVAGAFADEEPPAEAAHARRTMIGRSAEEVDHAPPRGRYAPVPAPESLVTGSALRWAAPAAALALASAVVVVRALRRRR
ncbi:SRPBCC family protein [Streptomyces bluensis]|uniref:SRPBCC family protein n=1 Tax=Streptomyces bluensis TaxID=33897 RepID=UPI00332E1A0B